MTSSICDPIARVAYRQPGWGDRDHDGVPNRFAPAPDNPYRR